MSLPLTNFRNLLYYIIFMKTYYCTVQKFNKMRADEFRYVRVLIYGSVGNI